MHTASDIVDFSHQQKVIQKEFDMHKITFAHSKLGSNLQTFYFLVVTATTKNQLSKKNIFFQNPNF